MSNQLPKGTVDRARSGFAMIDPETELYSHKLGRAQHVAISYVWSEWKESQDDRLPDWNLLRARLLELVGVAASSFMKIMTGHRKNCWLDSKCIDQDSPSDKAYWIPRMDEVYSEARCTVLLLRGLDLSPLVDAERQLGCHIDHDDHSCLLTQSCTSISDWNSLDEDGLIEALRILSYGTWRKRAWIFQEILLSDEYVISAERNTQLSLADCGVLAGLLFRRHVNLLWLGELAEWCRRLVYLRRRYLSYTLSAANVLQMAHQLEATVAADKYYALCGILRLKKLNYNPSHTVDEALQVVITELANHGQLSWLYAIRPMLDSQEQHKRLILNQRMISPYFDHVLRSNGSFYAKTKASSESIGFTVLDAGIVHKVIPLPEFLRQTRDHVSVNGRNFTPEQYYMQCLPRVLHKLATESITPLLQTPCIERLRKVFGLDPSAPTAEVVWQLFALDDHPVPPASGPLHNPEATTDFDLARKASWALKERVYSSESNYSLVLWQEAVESKTVAGTQTLAMEIAMGDINTPPGVRVCKVKGNPEIMIAVELGGNSTTAEASWHGALHFIWNHGVDKSSTSKVFRDLKSRISGHGPKSTRINFALGE
ncbi:hypothetical protein BX600DRAFT_461044 [Xylariales sp. PMI_506]|nr:hypothetical protein BX600DRAFT_461044 [Xylariales sp. PMI_506]